MAGVRRRSCASLQPLISFADEKMFYYGGGASVIMESGAGAGYKGRNYFETSAGRYKFSPRENIYIYLYILYTFHLKTYKKYYLITLLTKYYTLLQEQCHLERKTMSTKWQHKTEKHNHSTNIYVET